MREKAKEGVELRMSNIVADTLLSEGNAKSTGDSSSLSDYGMTVGEYLQKEADMVTTLLLFSCGAYHINIDWRKLNGLQVLVLCWRLFLVGSMLVFLCNEMELLVTLPITVRNFLMRTSLLIQFFILVPTLFNTSKRFRCMVTKTQTGVMPVVLRTYVNFCVFGVLTSLLYGYCVAFYGVYYLQGARLAFEAIGYGCGSLLSTWAILFVVLDVSVTLGEIGGLRELARRRTLTASIYKHSYNNSYQMVNSNSVAVCNAVAFSAYFNLFTFVVYIITTPATESFLLTIAFCVGILFREASFIFFIFPFFVGVNGAYAELVDHLAEEVWTHDNMVDSSTSLCVLVMRKPLSLSILGRVATMNEMYAQLSGLLLLSLTSFIRALEVSKYGPQ
jgi:hypothetical protein